MQIHGQSLTPAQLRRHIGHMDQVAGIQLVQLDDGRARASRAALVRTGTGFEFTVAIDRCLDIAAASHQGRALGWRSTAGDVAPQYYEAEGIRWLRSYSGGLVATCGLTNVGGPAPDSAESGVGLHGRIGNLPAENVQVVQEWRGNDYVMSITGTMRETRLFGEKLALTRTVSTKLGEDRFWIADRLVNEGFNKTPFMLLYHCNVGWPVIGEGTELIAPARRVAPRDEIARDGAKQWNRMDAPTRGYAEKVYYHDMAAARNGDVTAALVNPSGFGVYVKYNKKQLPRFVEWKMMGEQDYVVGLEPCNCSVQGRQSDEANGLLQSLRPGETREFQLELGAVTTPAQVKSLRAAAKTKPKMADSYLEFT